MPRYVARTLIPRGSIVLIETCITNDVTAHIESREAEAMIAHIAQDPVNLKVLVGDVAAMAPAPENTPGGNVFPELDLSCLQCKD